jgi:PKD repeat protein
MLIPGVVMKKYGLIIGVILIILAIAVLWYSMPDFLSTEQKRPMAKIEINQSTPGTLIINEGDMIFLSARNSSDDDGKIEDYQWNFGDGSTSSNVDTTHQYNNPGEYNVTLTVVDDDGNKDISYMIIRVNGLPNPIVEVQGEVHKSSKHVSIPIYEVIRFNANKSYDNDGEVVEYNWDFGDGNQSDKVAPRHQYFDIGTHDVILTVTDNNGGRSITEIKIDSILRTYSVKWLKTSRTVEIEPNGYTREGESTDIFYDLIQDNIATVNFTLNWTDRQPFLQNNEPNGSDLFELKTKSPENITREKNSTSGNITIIFNYNPQPSPEDYKAKTASDAISQALADSDLSNEGSGEWYFNISALECKGGSWVDDIFDLDYGNFWSLNVVIHYYELDIIEV